eukprot:TRINITY_DN7179_c0_g1_i2.p1 TRINITY_DN7179_c0_g1~~TRINITY_DN7179_c0_g1_i2.p1  ORF type:complete len:176 (+),score=29.81 TRINITY_DN7179_c0_g1_i2:222-749(+)
MATMDQMDPAERTRLASVGAIALNWRRIAGLLPSATVTEADVTVREPRGSVEFELSIKFVAMLSERMVPQDIVWSAMEEAGLRTYIPSTDVRQRIDKRRQQDVEQRHTEGDQHQADDHAKLEQETMRRLEEKTRRLEEQFEAVSEAKLRTSTTAGEANENRFGAHRWHSDAFSVC